MEWLIVAKGGLQYESSHVGIGHIYARTPCLDLHGCFIRIRSTGWGARVTPLVLVLCTTAHHVFSSRAMNFALGTFRSPSSCYTNSQAQSLGRVLQVMLCLCAESCYKEPLGQLNPSMHGSVGMLRSSQLLDAPFTKP
jgi:hypothetical protein